MRVEFVTIPFSHYCEKARWALDRGGVAYHEQGHSPIFSRRATKRVGAGKSVPALAVDGAIIADSTAIVAWADTQRPGALLPRDTVARAEALALEEMFDEQLGPATRRWAYFFLLPNKTLMLEITKQGVPSWQARAFQWFRPLAAGVIKRGLKIDAAGAQRSRQKIAIVFAHVSALLADGRPFLVGNAFSIADLTFAALAAPVLVPPEQRFGLPGPHVFPTAAQAEIASLRASPAGQFGRRIFAQHR